MNTVYISFENSQGICISYYPQAQISDTDTFLSVFDIYFKQYNFPLITIRNSVNSYENLPSDTISNFLFDTDIKFYFIGEF